MDFKRISDSLAFRLALMVCLTVITTILYMYRQTEMTVLLLFMWILSVRWIFSLFGKNMKKIIFMFDAIANNDYAFKYATEGRTPNDKMVSETLNRITQILFQAKTDAAQREKYYELIMNQVDTGIIVEDDKGYIYQTNNKALQLLGLPVFTHVCQLGKIDKELERLISNIQPGDKMKASYSNERGTEQLSFRVSEMELKGKRLRIIAINDINNELDDKEIESWIRLTRVLTHEIMNSVTPITSLSDTLLSLPKELDEEVRDGLEVISSTGKGLISFVESYRKFTHIPTPQPSLFYVKGLIERIVKLSRHNNDYPNIMIETEVKPTDLILHADENLISQVALNLIKNAMQAIGNSNPNGKIEISAYCDKNESVIIEVSNNGPLIPAEEADHIFVPFFTTKDGGSGIGLSISRQIMRLSGGSITMKSDREGHKTIFTLTFP